MTRQLVCTVWTYKLLKCCLDLWPLAWQPCRLAVAPPPALTPPNDMYRTNVSMVRTRRTRLNISVFCRNVNCQHFIFLWPSWWRTCSVCTAAIIVIFNCFNCSFLKWRCCVTPLCCSSREEDDPNKEEKHRQHHQSLGLNTRSCIRPVELNVFMSIFFFNAQLISTVFSS